MIFNHEVVIIGDGPAAISFFNRIKKKRENVALITTSRYPHTENIFSRYSAIDLTSPSSWKFLNCSDHTIVKRENFLSNPKGNKFTSIEYFGIGGLTNRWGAGCAKLNKNDLGIEGSLMNSIASYYQETEQQVGIYYQGNDALDDYLGEFSKSSKKLNSPYKITFPLFQTQWVKIGRTRQALLQVGNEYRKPCINCGGCFIYCQNKSIYNARYLLKASTEELYTSSTVTELSLAEGGYRLNITNNYGESRNITSKFVILAAGTLGSTRLLSSLIGKTTFSNFHHSIVARALFFSTRQEKVNNFPMGQYVAQIKIGDNKNAYASFIHGVSIPTSDIVDLLPIKNNLIYLMVNFIKKYLVVAMIFYSSEFSNYKIKLESGNLQFDNCNVSPYFKLSHKSALSRLKAIMNLNNLYKIPFLSVILPKGLDIHYGGTIPIGPNDYINCTEECEIRGFGNLYVVDGSWMPQIPEKPHTLTIIANAMRVADIVSSKLSKQ
jgi:hypothetical protein